MSDGSIIRGAVFCGALALVLALEAARPRLDSGLDRRRRWTSNLGLALVNGVMLALLPVATVSVALWAQARGWGLFGQVAWPTWIEAVAAWLVLDLGIYWQHRWLHEWRWLWPLHRVHHTDVALDATTGVRFHPGEILLSVAWKCALIVALGAPAVAVLAMELALNGFAFWSHANVKLPPGLDRVLRRLLITPDVHRVHHSVERRETDSNYGGSLVLWDHLFGSYVAAPAGDLDTMPVGLTELRAAPDQALPALLAQPLRYHCARPP